MSYPVALTRYSVALTRYSVALTRYPVALTRQVGVLGVPRYFLPKSALKMIIYKRICLGHKNNNNIRNMDYFARGPQKTIIINLITPPIRKKEGIRSALITNKR